MIAHILSTPSNARPFWATHERFEETVGTKVWTDCCACRVPAEDTISRIITSYDPPKGGDGCYQEEPDPWALDRCPLTPSPPTGAYYDARIETVCAEGCGCVVNPRKRRGMALRAWMRDGA